MTDFRFYVVAISAIFVALAAGVLLGAGPLRVALVDDLDSELDLLAAELELAQSDLAAERNRSESHDVFLEAAAPWILGDRLEEANVAIISVFEPNSARLVEMRSHVVNAGGTVVQTLDIGPEWTSDEHATFRAALAEQLTSAVETLEPGPDSASTLNTAFASMFVVPDEGQEASASVVLDVLQRSELVTGVVTAVPDVVIVVAGPGPSDLAQRARFHDYFVETLEAIAVHVPVVVASGQAIDADLPEQITATAGAAQAIATVRGGTSPEGLLATVLAASQALNGSVGHFGSGAADGLMPRP